MLDLTLFRNATFAGANMSMLLIGLAMFGDVLLRLALHAERARLLADAGGRDVPADDGADHPRRAERRAGSSDQIGAALADRPGHGAARRLARSSSRLGRDSTFWTLLPALLIGGVGMGLAMAPTTSAAMRAVPVDKAGVGSAVLNRRARSAARSASRSSARSSQRKSTRPDANRARVRRTASSSGLRVSPVIAFVGVAGGSVRHPHELRHEVPAAEAATVARAADRRRAACPATTESERSGGT